MSDAISAHGTIVSFQKTPGGAFSDIGEIGGDVVPPAMSRNSIEVTTHNDDIDAYVMGVLRRGEVTFPINYIAANGEHDELTGLYAHLIANTKTGYKVTFPDGDEWIFSGGVANIDRRAPVDGALTADVTLRPTGPMIINATSIS